MSNIIDLSGRRHAGLPLKIATSTGHKGEVTNVDTTWGWLIERLDQPTKDRLTLPQFLALSVPEQDVKKNNGYFVGGQFPGGRRLKAMMGPRCLITLDIDIATPALMDSLSMGDSGLGDLEMGVYSTRKHSREKPRLRVVLPLARPISHDKFIALSRILAQRVDPNMVTVDPVSFRPAQFMYWPSVCKGEDFFFRHNRGPLLDGDAVLAEWGNWQDFGSLPKSPREAKVRANADKKPDPREKKNYVGAFCKTYDVHEVIENFLSDVYAVSERGPNGTPTRYSFLAGSTSNGAVVYDDGMALESHHGTDPVAGLNVNPFDLYRIHRHGELDADAEEGTLAKDLPSYKAVIEDFEDDEKLQANLLDSWNYPTEDDDDPFDGIPLEDEITTTISKAKPSPDVVPASPRTITIKNWKTRLERNTDSGVALATLPNLITILKFAPAFRGIFRYDEFVSETVAVKKLVSHEFGVMVPGRRRVTDPIGRISDDHVDALRAILATPKGKELPGWGLKYSNEDIRQAIRVAAMGDKFHPVRDWLNGLTWDGVSRVEKMWSEVCHTPDDHYHRQTSRLTLLGAVTRVFEPGCKFDYAPILEGLEGLKKSMFVHELGYPWGGTSEADFGNLKEFVEATQGFWIVEIPELVPMTGKADQNTVKAGITRQAEHVRMSYGHFAKTFPRQFILIGTTNHDQYLQDTTGNRRFWPINCRNIPLNLDWLRANREQLWAETMHNYRAERALLTEGQSLALYMEDEVEAKQLQASRVLDDGSDEWAAHVLKWLDTPVPASHARCGVTPDAGDFAESADEPLMVRRMTCAKEVWVKVWGKSLGDYHRAQVLEVNRALRKVKGWAMRPTRDCGVYGEQRVLCRLSDYEDDL